MVFDQDADKLPGKYYDHTQPKRRKYTVEGNQLTITPASGANEEWSVTGGLIRLAAMSDVQIRGD